MAISGLPPIVPIQALQLTNAVDPSSQSNAANVAEPASNGGVKAGTDFGQFLSDALQQVNAIQQQGEAASAALITGQVQDVHSVMLAVEKANLSLGLTVEVRNKVLDAYHEIMRMQI